MFMSCKDKHQSSLQKLLLAIGKRIRLERERLGYTQEQLAEKAGFHRTYVGMVERGEQNITLESCTRFADALGVGFYELMHDILLEGDDVKDI
jgi:transcriptional regulator with XRE-family HTH domain